MSELGGKGRGRRRNKPAESRFVTRIDSVFFSQVNPCKATWAADSEDSETALRLAGPLYIGSIPALNPNRPGPRASPDRCVD